MDIRNEVLELLDPVSGLRCLWGALKLRIYQRALQATEGSLWELAPRLRVCKTFIEPLAVDPARGGHPDFAALCKKLAHRLESTPSLACVAAENLSRPIKWLQQAVDSQADGPVCLYQVAQYFGSWPNDCEENWNDWEAAARWLMSVSLTTLERPDLAIQVQEGYARLTPADYDPPVLRDKVHQERLVELEANNRASFLAALADALSVVQGRGHEQAAMLLEAYLNLEPGDYGDATLLREKFQSGPLAGLVPTNRAALLSTLAEAVAFSVVRGRAQAAMLLEAYLELEPTDFAHPTVLRQKLQHGPLEEFDPDKRANLLTSLAAGLLFIPGRGHLQAALLLETYLELEPADYRNPPILRRKLQCGPLAEVHPDNGATCLHQLAEALLAVTGRGGAAAVGLLEAYLEVELQNYDDPVILYEKLQQGALMELARNNRFSLVRTLAEALAITTARGRAQAARLMEVHLQLEPRDFENPVMLPLANLAVNTWATYLRTVVSVMRHMEAQQLATAVLLCECYLHLDFQDYDVPEALRQKLKHGRLSKIDANNQATLLIVLADALSFMPGRGFGQVAALLEGYLELDPSDYDSAALLRQKFQHGPMSQLAANNRASILSALTYALLVIRLTKSEALAKHERAHPEILVEALLSPDTPMSGFANLAAFDDLSAGNLLAVLGSWISATDIQHPDLVPTCEALITYIRTIRDDKLTTYQDRHDFITSARSLWPELERVAFTRAEMAREAGNDSVADGIEMGLLHWSEQFENRLLLEELRLTGERAGDDGAQLAATWRPNRWSFLPPWEKRVLSRWDASSRIAWLDQRRLPTAAALSVCLEDVAVSLTDLSGSYRQPVRSKEVHDYREPEHLYELVPEGAVWIRVVFDQQGRLNWWACQRNGEELVRLAAGKSQPGARARLERANLDFDAATDRIWAALRSGELELPLEHFTRAVKEALRDRSGYLQREMPTIQERDAFGQVKEAELRTIAAKWPLLAAYARQLLAWLLDPTSTKQSFPRAAWEFWTAGRELQRRAELDETSAAHLHAVQQELDLSTVWNQAAAEIVWEQTDILFQVQGPLLAAPLAWLSFGGEPLYRRVASTTSVVSLTLRQFAQDKLPQSLKSQDVVSALWEEPNPTLRARRHGFPLLLAGLQSVAQEHGWPIWNLGDDPQTTRAHVCAAVAEKSPRVVVIGAHGVHSAAGVKLRDAEPWCGGGADLSFVDLLVLVSCAVGRLAQQGQRDVEGMYARLAVHGARCVVAARWVIADVEAACLAVELMHQYLLEVKTRREPGPFARSRALNRARRTLLDSGEVSFHLAAALEIYGLG